MTSSATSWWKMVNHLDGTHAWENGENVSFMANAFLSKGKNFCTLSNVNSDAPTDVEIEQIVGAEVDAAT